MKKMLLASITVSMLILWALGCGGGGGGGTPVTPTVPSNPAPSNPSPPGPAPSPQVNPTTVNIVGSAGSGAFSPNPVQVPAGGSILWTNSTGNPHVLVMSDGTPIATLAPGASATTAAAASGDFRCVTHPSMVGSINGPSVPAPPGDQDDDGYLAPAVARR